MNICPDSWADADHDAGLGRSRVGRAMTALNKPAFNTEPAIKDSVTEWTPWFAWYWPVHVESVGWRMGRVEYRMQGGIRNGVVKFWPVYRIGPRRRLTAGGRMLVTLAIVVPAALVLAVLFLVPSRFGFGGW